MFPIYFSVTGISFGTKGIGHNTILIWYYLTRFRNIYLIIFMVVKIYFCKRNVFISQVILTLIIISVINFYMIDSYNKGNYNMTELNQDLLNLEIVSQI